MNLNHLKPQPGDDVEEWWARVMEWAKTLTVEIGPGMRATQGLGNGLKLLVQQETPVRTPFRVGLSGRRATVSRGYLGGQVPFVVAENGTAVRLDGTREDGITPDPLGKPSLDLREASPGEDGRSAIALRVKLDANGGPLDEKEDPEALRVLHVSEFGAAEKRRLMETERVALQELAIVYWTANGKEPDRVGQVVRHNLRLSYAAGGEGKPGRAFFAAI